MNSDRRFFLGYPNAGANSHIALYQPVIDRFFFVTNDSVLATEMIYLASGRYSLFPCDITTAANYHHNVIDNMCCQNWTMSDHGSFSLNTHYDVTLIKISSLVEAGPTDSIDWNSEKQWLQMVYRYSKFCKDARESYPWFLAQKFIQDALDLGDGCDVGRLVSSTNLIRRELYLNRDPESMQNQIQDIINRNPYLCRRYQLECASHV